ncbi:MAG: DAK2 domain-containing protein, partial [Erysipelotrichaceae bacterium]|nr:DAK2 domain-containing protein [Erysipelotrichaceae bacterium]
MNIIDGLTLKGMLKSGANNLSNEKNNIDALKVFPVPDGDTGTNMSMTFSNGVNEVFNNGSEELSAVAKTLSRGLLMGARGNSGVILSQIFRGFYQSIDGKQEISVLEFANAMFKGSTVAYKAVMRPVEGTILTVIREASEYAKMHVENNPECSMEEYLEVLCKEGHIALEHTPELLPVLKEVGVVDSGGAGLLKVLEGFKAYIDGQPIEAHEQDNTVSATAQMEIENEGFGYCTEFIVRLDDNNLKTFQEEKLRRQLAKLGESIVVVQDEEIVKVHVHTLKPGDALNLAQMYGEFVKLKIENMQEQHNNLTSGAVDPSSTNSILTNNEAKEPAEYAIIAVAAGEGLSQLFKDYRVDHIISGGQTMNPSTEDFVSAINKIAAKHIFILPNNSNIIMAAKQAAIVCEDKDIHVFETKSIPQGLSACIMFNPECDKDTNIA